MISIREELRPLRERVAKWATIDAFQCYMALLQGESPSESIVTDIALPEQWAASGAWTVEELQQDRVPYEDIAPLLFMKSVLEGVPTGHKIQHVIIDEAQDYSMVHYEVLKQQFPGCRFTVLGDMNQAIHPHTSAINYAQIGRVLNGADTPIFRLTKSYRSTRQIAEFAASILNGGEPVEFYNREGDLPRTIQVEDPIERTELLLSLIGELVAQGAESVAVLTRTADASSQIHTDISAKTQAQLLSKDDDTFRTGIVVAPVYMAKGLEFDAVIVADGGDYLHDNERRLLYTACTRALHQMVLLYSDAQSPLWPQIDSGLFQVGRA